MSSLSSVGATTSALTSSAAGSSSPTGTLSVGGLISGLNTSQLIQGLLAVQQAQINTVQARETATTQRETAYKVLQAQLITFQSSVSQLALPVNGPFDGRTATSSNQAVVTAAASSTAVPGVYSFTVGSLAQANEVASQGFASANGPITQGTVVVGGSSKQTITIDGTNNTLQGLAAAINSANAGVNATIVNTGSGAQPYRLLLTATQTGTANAVSIDTSGLAPSDPTGATTQPTFTTVQQATDASITFGSGAGALTVTSPSNTVNTAINGVTLSLLGTSTGQAVQVTVANDTDTAQKAVQDFVTNYNNVISTISNDIRYDPQTRQAGVLLGDPSILNIENQLRELVTAPVAGANPKLNSLIALGLTGDATGQLQVDGGRLSDVLAGKVSGVTLTDVRNLFAAGGQSTSGGVTFLNATAATKPSATPYGVDVTQAALQATLTGDTQLAQYTPVTAPGNTFTLTASGVTSNPITIPPSSAQGYTQQELVQALQAQINADAKIGNQGVTVGLQGNKLTFTSAGYGQAAALSIGAAPFLGFTTAQAANGQDVAGSFLVNGTAESATGRGQILTGNTGNANTDGLAVQVTLLPSQVSAAPNTPEASLTVTQGVAAQLSGALNKLLDPVTGQLHTIDQNFQSQLTVYQDQINQLQKAYSAKQAQLTTEFTNLETTLSGLKTASSFLAAQATALTSTAGSSSSTAGH